MTQREEKQHWLSAFYMRRFTCDLKDIRDKNKLRVFVLNKHGITEKKRINSLCQMRNYNSTNEESEIFELKKTNFQQIRSYLEQLPSTIRWEHAYESMIWEESPSEINFKKIESVFAHSVDAILEKNQSLIDMVNMKYLINYFLSNSPNYRAAVTRDGEGSVNERIKGKGFLTELALSQTLPLLSDCEVPPLI